MGKSYNRNVMNSRVITPKIKAIFPAQRQLLLWIASSTGFKPVPPILALQVDNPVQELKKVISKDKQLYEKSVSGSEIGYVFEGRKHVPWSTKRYFDTKATGFLAKLAKERKGKVTPSERANTSNDLIALEKRGLIKRLDHRTHKTTNRHTTHVRLTDKGRFYVQVYWDSYINRGMLAAPPPMSNIMWVVEGSEGLYRKEP